MTIAFTVFGWEVELFAWVRLSLFTDVYYQRRRWLAFLPDEPPVKIDMAYGEAICPVGGIAFEFWNYKDLERVASK